MQQQAPRKSRPDQLPLCDMSCHTILTRESDAEGPAVKELCIEHIWRSVDSDPQLRTVVGSKAALRKYIADQARNVGKTRFHVFTCRILGERFATLPPSHR